MPQYYVINKQAVYHDRCSWTYYGKHRDPSVHTYCWIMAAQISSTTSPRDGVYKICQPRYLIDLGCIWFYIHNFNLTMLQRDTLRSQKCNNPSPTKVYINHPVPTEQIWFIVLYVFHNHCLGKCHFTKWQNWSLDTTHPCLCQTVYSVMLILWQHRHNGNVGMSLAWHPTSI